MSKLHRITIEDMDRPDYFQHQVFALGEEHQRLLSKYNFFKSPSTMIPGFVSYMVLKQHRNWSDGPGCAHPVLRSGIRREEGGRPRSAPPYGDDQGRKHGLHVHGRLLRTGHGAVPHEVHAAGHRSEHLRGQPDLPVPAGRRRDNVHDRPEEGQLHRREAVGDDRRRDRHDRIRRGFADPDAGHELCAAVPLHHRHGASDAW